MRLILAVGDAAGRIRRDVQAELDDAATVGDLADLLQSTEPALPSSALFLGSRRLDPDLTVSASGLRHGDLVTLGGPGRDEPAVGRWELAVVGGPSAGLTMAVTAPGITIGRGRQVDLSLDDDEVSRRHATVHALPDGFELEDHDSRNGIWIGDHRVSGRSPLRPGVPLQLGQSVLTVRPPVPQGTIVGAGPEPGTVLYNRPPRLWSRAEVTELSRPSPPNAAEPGRFPLALTALPALLGVGMALFQRSPTFLLFALASPLMMAASALSDRHGRRRTQRAERAAFERDLQAYTAALEDAVHADEESRREAAPDPAAILRTAVTVGRRLWEREPNADGFLEFRLGLADRPARVRVRSTHDPTGGESPLASMVPVTVPLREAGVLGLAGPSTQTRRLSRAVLASAAVMHSPSDLVVTIAADDGAAAWDWAKWLPHLRTAHLPGTGTARTAFRRADAERLVGELAALVEQRTELASGGATGETGPAVLLVLDGARRMRSLPRLEAVLGRGPAVGVYAICLDEDETALPRECRAVMVAGAGSATVRIRLPGGEQIHDVLADGLTEELADRVARALAPVRELGNRTDGGDLPAMVRYLDLVGLPEITASDLVAGWEASDDESSTRILLGVAEQGRFAVDLRRDGPHALVAGTTGAGKSELLQTMIASLALGNRPEALNFLLIDYKGGSAFKQCEQLPHTVGMVTDLDDHEVERALTSLRAELRRREQLLAAAAAADLEQYRLRRVHGAPQLARLVIVVDEFAVLSKEMPQFVEGLVDVATRGRSMGIHLVLGTQKPAGNVSSEIRANVSLRLCLRVSSAAASQDVIDVPDAALISPDTPGRAYAHVDQGRPVRFQTARIAVPRPAADTGSRGRGVAPTLTPLTAATAGKPAEPPKGAAGPVGHSDLRATVDAVAEAARLLGCAPPHRPWLPALPDRLRLGDLERREEVAQALASPTSVAVGLADLPDRQAQHALVVDLERAGHLLVVGGMRSGRTTLLRTLAGALARRMPVARLHLYAVDLGGGLLDPLGRLPHCGAVVTGDEPDRLQRLMMLLKDKVEERQRRLRASGSTSITELRGRTTERHPDVVVLVDRYDLLLAEHGEADGGELVGTLARLLQEGPAVGIFFILTTDRVGSMGRLLSVAEARLVLRLQDRDGYAALGIPPRCVPRSMVAGRALWAPAQLELPHEVQLAVLADDPAGQAQAEAVHEIARAAAERALPPGGRPSRVDPLPDVISLTEVDAATTGPGHGPGTVPIGVGGVEVRPVRIDLADNWSFVVTGPVKSGRSTALATIAAGLLDAGRHPLLILTPRPSPLRKLDGHPGVLAVLDAPDQLATSPPSSPVALLVDDAEMVATAPELDAFVHDARDAGHVLAAAVRSDHLPRIFAGWLAEVRSQGAGIALLPHVGAESDFFGLPLPRSRTGGLPKGRGLLVRSGAWTLVQVAQP
jgi:DNA segregation ATPase FtsK/SpoIIIE, S-DNA-T family